MGENRVVLVDIFSLRELSRRCCHAGIKYIMGRYETATACLVEAVAAEFFFDLVGSGAEPGLFIIFTVSSPVCALHMRGIKYWRVHWTC